MPLCTKFQSSTLCRLEVIWIESCQNVSAFPKNKPYIYNMRHSKVQRLSPWNWSEKIWAYWKRKDSIHIETMGSYKKRQSSTIIVLSMFSLTKNMSDTYSQEKMTPLKKNTSHPRFQHIPLSLISSYTNGFHPSRWIHRKRREVYYNRKSIESIARATRPQAQKQQQCI